MTKKKETPAKRGRKPKAESEKLGQLTIRLRTDILFGLELVSKHRHTSLNQAAEYLVSMALREYEVDGRSVMLILELLKDYQDKKGRSGISGDEWVQLMLKSAAGRAFLTPDTLRTPSERTFMAAVNVPKGTRGHPSFLPFQRPDLMDKIFSEFLAIERTGLAADELVTVAGELVEAAWAVDRDERIQSPEGTPAI